MIQPYQVVKDLDFVRIAGSAGEQRAIEVLSGYLRQLGLEPQLEPFDLHCFEPGNGWAEVNGKRYDLLPFGLSSPADVTGTLHFLENPDVLRLNRGAYDDKIVLLGRYGRDVQEALKSCRAVIVMGPVMRQAPSWSHRQKSYEDGVAPSLSVSYDTGAQLARMDGKQVRVVIEQEAKKVTAHNIVAHIPGRGLDRNLLYGVAHYDTVNRTPGASDNTGGTAVLLALAEKLTRKQPGRDFRLVWFSGEEMGLRGSLAYVQQHEEEVRQRAAMVLNIDVTGDDVGVNRYAVIGTEGLRGWVDGVTREIGLSFASAIDIYSSDAMPFAVHEIPSVNIARGGGKASFHIHTPGDKLANVSPRGFVASTRAAENLARRWADAAIFPHAREIDDKLREKIEKYFYRLTLEKPELHWEPKYKRP